MFLIDKLMNKMKCSSFNREQLDIIEKYNKRDKILFLYIVGIFILEILVNMIFHDDSLLSNVISIVISVTLVMMLIYYGYFKITKQKNIISKLGDEK